MMWLLLVVLWFVLSLAGAVLVGRAMRVDGGFSPTFAIQDSHLALTTPPGS